MTKTVALTVVAGATLAANAQVWITGIVDGDLDGGNPKAVELYVNGTVDLAGLTILKSTNGTSWGSPLALSGVYTNEFVYLVGTANGGEAQFNAVFGNSGDFANRILSSIINGNGNDGFRMIDSSANVIDEVWTQNATFVYQDSWLYRKDATGPDGGWIAANWTFGGNGALDGLDAAQHAAAIPFGTFKVPSPASFALLGLGGLIAARRRRG